MLVIRQGQMTTFRTAARQSFLIRVEQHLRDHFPQCEAMRPADLRDFVELGIARAGAYGIERERDVCKYLSLMAVFGPKFDVEQPWAKETLGSPAGPRLKLSRLYMRGQRHADAMEEVAQ